MTTMPKPFDEWNRVKQQLHSKNNSPGMFFHEREVWWCSIGVNVGVESDGKNAYFERPVLIIKKFNGHMLWVIPLTSKFRDGIHFHKIQHERGVSFACLSQLKTISSKRLLRKVGMIPESEFGTVCRCIAGYLQNRTPR